MTMIRRIFFFIGRVLLSLIFLIAGIKKILYWQSVEESIAMKICEWNTHLHGLFLFEILLRFVPMMLAFAIFFELVGALIILSGYFFRFGAFLLLIFLIPTTIFFHDFWFQIGDKQTLELTMFMKNLSIMGSLLLFSLGYRFKKQEQ